MIAAIKSKNVKSYIGFDPNRNLRDGYIKLMQLFNIKLTDQTNDSLSFSNGFRIISLPFETGVKMFNFDNFFDLVFTSPPYFDYEVYDKENPSYEDWIMEFYTPLVEESCRCLKQNGYLALHISDTSAGNITPFMKEVPHITTLRMRQKIGLEGYYSKEIRPVYIFQKE